MFVKDFNDFCHSGKEKSTVAPHFAGNFRSETQLSGKYPSRDPEILSLPGSFFIIRPRRSGSQAYPDSILWPCSG
jgi:hypothetical protein